MSGEFHNMEESLKEFLTDAQNDSYNSRNANLYKYNNLKIFMDPQRIKLPHLIIRIGISEAMYDIEKGEKISGGVGSDERLVRRWFDRNLSKFDLGAVWKASNKFKTVTMKEDADED